MIKVMINDKDDKGIKIKYERNEATTLEHLTALCTLYKQIKLNTDLTDKQIFDCMVTCSDYMVTCSDYKEGEE